MTQHKNPCKDDMTALRFRDSPQDILLRPREQAAGKTRHSSAHSPFASPVPAGFLDATHAARNLYHNCLHYTKKANLVKS